MLVNHFYRNTLLRNLIVLLGHTCSSEFTWLISFFISAHCSLLDKSVMMRNDMRWAWYCILQDIMEVWCVCAQLASTVGNCSLFAASLLCNFSLYHSISPFLLRLIVQTKHMGDNRGRLFFWTGRSSTPDTQWAMKLFPYAHAHTSTHCSALILLFMYWSAFFSQAHMSQNVQSCSCILTTSS